MPLFYLHDFGFLEKTLHESSKILVEHALVLLGYSFEPRLRHGGLRYGHRFIKNRMLTLGKTVSNFKGLTRFSQSRLFSFSSFRNMQKQKTLGGVRGRGGGEIVGRGSSRNKI